MGNAKTGKNLYAAKFFVSPCRCGKRARMDSHESSPAKSKSNWKNAPIYGKYYILAAVGRGEDRRMPWSRNNLASNIFGASRALVFLTAQKRLGSWTALQPRREKYVLDQPHLPNLY
jgi:hypothetical protein